MRRLALFATLFFAGCPKGQLPNLEQFKPTLSFQKFELKGIDFEKADVDFIFKLDNPNPVGLNIAKFDWNLALADQPFLDGVRDKGWELPASGERNLRLPVAINWQKLIETGRAVKGQDEIPFKLNGRFTIETPLGPLTLPYQHDGQLPLLHKPELRLATARVANLNLLQQTARIEVDLGVKNEQASPIGFSKFDYNLKLGGKQVAVGKIPGLTDLTPGKEQVVTLPIDLKLVDFGTQIVQAIKDKGPVDIGLVGDAVVRTPWGEAPLAVDRSQRLTLK